MIPDYDDLDADETYDTVSRYDGSYIVQFIEYEMGHRERETLVERLATHLVRVRAPDSDYYEGLWFPEGVYRVFRDGSEFRATLPDELEIDGPVTYDEVME